MHSAPGKLGPSILAALSRLGVSRLFREGTVLLSEGDTSSALYIILEGRTRAYMADADGPEVVLSVMGPGEYFGEVAFDGGPRSASVITVEPSRLVIVPREEFAAFLEGNPAFAWHFILRLIHRVRSLTDKVQDLAYLDARGRVARLLLENAAEAAEDRYVPVRLTPAQIASHVDCPRETVKRVLEDLVREHHIAVQSDRIVVDRHAAEGR